MEEWKGGRLGTQEYESGHRKLMFMGRCDRILMRRLVKRSVVYLWFCSESLPSRWRRRIPFIEMPPRITADRR
jgi:hypothetical protein